MQQVQLSGNFKRERAQTLLLPALWSARRGRPCPVPMPGCAQGKAPLIFPSLHVHGFCQVHAPLRLSRPPTPTPCRREPYLATKKDERQFMNFWSKHIMVPAPDYASRRVSKDFMSLELLYFFLLWTRACHSHP